MRVAALVCLALSGPALADAGRIEINQARALAGGVTPADLPGFPVTLSLGGSYLLTSDLVPGPSLPALELQQNGISVDLNGFTLRGSSLIGTPASGIVSYLLFGFNSRIHNGRIEDFMGRGIDLEDLAGIEVRDVLVTGSAQGGIALGDDGRVHGVRALSNAVFGLSLGATTAFDAVVVNGTSGTDVIGGVQIGPSYCEDGSCWAQPPRRRFYLTLGTAPGSQAASRCATGFHFASLFEILNPSALQYDTSRGYTPADSGESAPVWVDGWARTGSFSAADAEGGNDAGWVNCNVWTSASGADHGSAVFLANDWVSTPPAQANPIAPWRGRIATCLSEVRVWCVED